MLRPWGRPSHRAIAPPGATWGRPSLLMVLAGLGGGWSWRRWRASAEPRPAGSASRPTTPPVTAALGLLTEDFQFPSPGWTIGRAPSGRGRALPGVGRRDACRDDRRPRRVRVRIGQVPAVAGELAIDHRSRGSWAIRSSWRAARPTPPPPMRPRSTRRWPSRARCRVGDTLTVTPLTTAQLGELEAGVELDAAGHRRRCASWA